MEINDKDAAKIDIQHRRLMKRLGVDGLCQCGGELQCLNYIADVYVTNKTWDSNHNERAMMVCDSCGAVYAKRVEGCTR